MSLLADALQPFFVPGLNAIQGRVEALTLADLIGKQARTGFNLDFSDAEQAIVTDFRDPAIIISTIASDSSRFASAALQSIKLASSGILQKHTLAWALIQAYYASFYAGHAITRFVGESCSYFDRSHIARILKLGQAYGKAPGFKLRASAYHCTLSTDATTISSISMRDGAGGAHEAFWNTFSAKLEAMNERILIGSLGEVERQTVFSKLEDYRRSLSTGNAPLYSFLSVMRNQIQYRHSNDAWLPSRLRRTDLESLSRLLSQWERDPMSVDVVSGNIGELGTFVSVCAFTVSLCVALLERIAERSTTPSRSFASLGPLTLLK